MDDWPRQNARTDVPTLTTAARTERHRVRGGDLNGQRERGPGPANSCSPRRPNLSLADTLAPCEFLFAIRALHAGKGRGIPGGLDFDELAVESAGDLAGLIIDRMDGPVWHVVTAFSRSDGVGPNPMAAFGARLPRHAANRRRQRTPASAPGARRGNLCAVTVLLSWQGALMSMVVLIALWLVFLAFLVVARPDTGTLRGLPRMLPDTLRVVGRLARDRSVPRSARLPA